MAYNFYQPYQAYQPQQSNSSIIWVQGEAGAKSYMVAPNTTAQLWDSEAQVIYLKSADATGMPSMRVLDYTIRDNTPKQPQNAVLQQQGDYPTRKEFEALKTQINALKERIERSGKDEPIVHATE